MPDIYSCEMGWYCLKAIPKKEHLAATMLEKDSGIEAFSPRISFVKKTRRGKVRFVEALFPGYLFVHTALKETFRVLMATHGVKSIVCYGDMVPVVPERFIEELRSRLKEDLHEEPEPTVALGQTVTLTEGPFQDLRGIISGTVPAKDRVKVLLELLGQQIEIEISSQSVWADLDCPKEKLWKS